MISKTTRWGYQIYQIPRGAMSINRESNTPRPPSRFQTKSNTKPVESSQNTGALEDTSSKRLRRRIIMSRANPHGSGTSTRKMASRCPTSPWRARFMITGRILTDWCQSMADHALHRRSFLVEGKHSGCEQNYLMYCDFFRTATVP